MFSCFFPTNPIGPFLSSIMKLVSHMPTNHLYVNLQVTRLVVHLLALPLPLMRLQLLSLSPQEASGAEGQRFFSTLMVVRQWFDCFINLHFSSAFNATSEGGASFANLVNSIREAVFRPPTHSCPEPRISNATGKFPYTNKIVPLN